MTRISQLLNWQHLWKSQTLRDALPLIDRHIGVMLDLIEESITPDSFNIFYMMALTPRTGRHGIECRRDGTGFALTRERSISKAIGEAIEAYSVAMHWGQVEFIQAPFTAVANIALNPQEMSLVSPDEAEQIKDIPEASVPFDPDLPMLWMWGTNLATERAVLVPVSMVYMPYSFLHNDPRIWQPTSSGLACGSSFAAAVLSGLLEVVERDALLMAWWNRLPCPRVSPQIIAENPYLGNLLERIAHKGLTLIVNNVTMETGIPVYMAWLVDYSRRLPTAVMGASAHLDPQYAIHKAVVEACQVYLSMRSYFKKQTTWPNFGIEHKKVRTFRDHGLLYSRPDMLPALQFLHEAPLDNRLLPTSLASGDAEKDCHTCLQRLTDKGLDAYVVNLTMPETIVHGFHVVRTLITGTQHLTCLGPVRLLANPRLYRIPQLLGYREHDSQPDELNPLPHPIA